MFGFEHVENKSLMVAMLKPETKQKAYGSLFTDYTLDRTYSLSKATQVLLGMGISE